MTNKEIQERLRRIGSKEYPYGNNKPTNNIQLTEEEKSDSMNYEEECAFENERCGFQSAIDDGTKNYKFSE